MKKILALALGLITAVGGFIDIGDVVFAAQAGAKFGYTLLWAIVVGVVGIMVYGEMSGRVAAVGNMTVFDIIRKKFPPKLGFAALVLSLIVTLMSAGAEIGGIALVLKLLSGFPYQLLIVVVLILLLVACWFLPFGGIERVFGYVGLGTLTIIVVALKSNPDLATIGAGLVPHALGGSALSYWYFAVGIFAATLMPYEIYFYSSGGIEEGWNKKSLVQNTVNSYIGFGLGALLVVGFIMASANVLLPAGISPNFIGTPLLSVLSQLGEVGLLIILLGLLFTIGGAAVETSFSAAYSLSQFAGWKWGKHQGSPRKVPRFTATWVIFLVLGAAIVMTGIDPVQLTEYAVIFSVMVMPLTYYPILKTAEDKRIMGIHANGGFMKTLARIYFGIVLVVALTAVPLMLITHQGQL